MGVLRKEVLFSAISIPFVLLFAAELLGARQMLAASLVNSRLQLLSDLVLMNNVHVCFSFFLYYKISEFREVYNGLNMPLMLGLTALLVMGMMWMGWNGPVIVRLATMHAYLQSLGIFFLYFSLAERRQTIKYLAWGFLALLLILQSNFFEMPVSFSYAIAAVVFLVFSYFSKSWLGVLFSFRFGLWFVGGSSVVGIAEGSMHGLEYLLVVSLLVKNKNMSIVPRDIPVIAVLLGLLGGYTINRYAYGSLWPLDVLFFFFVYCHYMFDSYVFRFKFAKQRRLILPLFVRAQ